MDLTDEDIIVYAEVLLGVRNRFPKGYIDKRYRGDDAKRKARKYLVSLLAALDMTPRKFIKIGRTYELINTYRLIGFHKYTYSNKLIDFLREVDNTITLEEIYHGHRKWKDLTLEQISEILSKISKKTLTLDLRRRAYMPMVNSLFQGKPRLAIEFVYPGTYPQYQEDVTSLKQELKLKEKIKEHLNEISRLSKELEKSLKNLKIEKRLGLPYDQVIEIIEAHSNYNGNIQRAARYLPYCRNTIKKYWRQAGLNT